MLCQCLITLIVKIFFLMSTLNVPWCSFVLFACVCPWFPASRDQHFPLLLLRSNCSNSQLPWSFLITLDSEENSRVPCWNIFHRNFSPQCPFLYTLNSSPEEYRLSPLQEQQIIWKIWGTQTDRGQQRLHRTICFLVRAARDISQYLENNPIRGGSGIPSLQEGCHTSSSVQ